MNSRISQQAESSTYAREQFELGKKYRLLTTGDRQANLQRSIQHFNEALRFWTAQSAPADYALAQNNLGIVYYNLPTGNRVANLRRAIDCYTEALRIWTTEFHPRDHATASDNLGLAHAALLTGDRAANLARAIECYTEALRFRTAEANGLALSRFSVIYATPPCVINPKVSRSGGTRYTGASVLDQAICL